MAEAKADDRPPFHTLAIAGLGLVGGSLAAAASRAWPALRIVGVDRADVTAEALRRGWIREARPSVADLGDAGLLVLAVPVPRIVSIIADLGTLGIRVPTTDVGSTKRAVAAAARRAGLSSFVGGHPMAGGEGSGIDSARADLFAGRRWLVVSPDDVAEDVVHRVEALAVGVGAVPLRVDAETHDRVMASVSHLPQLLAVALANAVSRSTGESGVQMAGRALAEMTRLASSPPELWRGIIDSNADFTADAIDALRAELDALDPRLAGTTALPTSFTRAAAFRDALQKVAP